MKKILITGIILLVAGIIGIAFIVLSAMTDPTPPQVRAGWYLPGQDIVWTPFGPNPTHLTQERLILSGHQDGSVPQFPALSPYCRYENYTHFTTKDPYMIAVWYFNDNGKFLESQKNLVTFLETDGKISSATLNFTENPQFRKSATSTQDSQTRSTISDYIKATGYESVTTSGYFFTVTIPGPGIPAEDNFYTVKRDYYIVYYGTTTPACLSSQTPCMREMIAETYRYDSMSSVGPLI
ncbi:MAG TPA: hypothetical protein P5013_07265 [Methanoregula sp.]|nr:hypothetical protein [Methanoregula sp.]